MENNGKIFEEAQKKFLDILIEDIFNKKDSGFKLNTEPTIQNPGTQYGRDITVEWSYNGTEYRWWFECKDYKSKSIPKQKYADKILETLLKQKKPTCFCLIATFKGPCNWFRQIKDDLDKQRFKRPNVFFWPLEGPNGFKTALKCYPKIFEKIYPKENEYPEKDEREKILKNIKEFIIINNERGRKRLKEKQILLQIDLQSPDKEKFVSEKEIRETDNISKQLKYYDK